MTTLARSRKEVARFFTTSGEFERVGLLMRLDQMERIGYLATLIARQTKRDGLHDTALPGLALSRYSTRSTPRKSLDRAVLCFVAQGAKSVLSARQRWTYKCNHILVSSMDVPLVAQIEEATRAKPFLGVDLYLNLSELEEVCEAMPGSRSSLPVRPHGILLSPLTDALLDALIRLLELLDKPQEAAFMYPLIRREIVYRVLSCNGGALCKTLDGGSQAFRVGQGVQWLKSHLGKSVKAQELARAMSMSLTAMHNAFKTTTGLSPVQFHQQLRLHEARRILLYERESAEIASLRVGYGSASQFSREYCRLFGAPPRQDVSRIPW